MPDWLIRQFTQAFYNKDKYRIKLLNDFWFSFLEKEREQKVQKRLS
ncbi:cortex morphogenetic protein CmpA [Vulcanibacillus modesticaldus]|nr:cortex morphogenetic protein CmpA [Vulcanibacillus modesticaldus]